MTISNNYKGLQLLIADDLGDRQDLLAPLSDSALTLSPIQQAIQDAIARWEREIFYFNDLNDTDGFSTAIGQEFYGATTAPVSDALIATVASFDNIHVLVANNRYPLIKRSWKRLEDMSVNPSVTGEPIEYAYFANMLRLYPIPNGIYPVTMSGTQRLSPLINDNDTNAWTQDAFNLIRAEAKKILGEGPLNDPDLVTQMARAIYGDPMDPRVRGHLYDLKAETSRRQYAPIEPTYF